MVTHGTGCLTWRHSNHPWNWLFDESELCLLTTYNFYDIYFIKNPLAFIHTISRTPTVTTREGTRNTRGRSLVGVAVVTTSTACANIAVHSFHIDGSGRNTMHLSWTWRVCEQIKSQMNLLDVRRDLLKVPSFNIYGMVGAFHIHPSLPPCLGAIDT